LTQGKYLIREGDLGESMFIIIEGTCVIMKEKKCRDGSSEQVKLATISDN